MSRLLLAIRAIDSAASLDDLQAIDAELAKLDRRRAFLAEIRDGICERMASASVPALPPIAAPGELIVEPPAASPPPAYVEPGRIVSLPAAAAKAAVDAREDADPSSLASKIHDLIDEEGSLPVTVIAKRLGRTVQGVRLAMTKSGWFRVGPDDEVRIAKR